MSPQDTSADGRAVAGVGPRAVALVVALFVVNAAWNVLLNTVVVRSGLGARAGVAYDVTLPLSGAGAAAWFAAATVVGVALLAALARSTAPDSDALGGGETPGETLFAYGRAVAVAVAGTAVAAVGLAALVVPGLLVLVHLPLVFVAVATDGDSVGRAVGRAWSQARGARARLAAIGLAVVAVPFAVSVITILTDLLSPVAELAAGVVVTTAAAAVGVVAFTSLAASLVGITAGRSGTESVTPTGSRQL